MFPLKDNVAHSSSPILVWGLILINVLVFLSYGLAPIESQEQVVLAYGTIPTYLLDPGPEPQPIPAVLTLLTSMFLHGGWAHLLGNMYFLYLFGDNVEDRLGKLSFLAFYVVTGVIAGLAHVYTNADSAMPAVGASGAISGILGAYMVMFPKAKVRTIIAGGYARVVDVPAVFFLLFWFGGQLLSGVNALIAPESVGIAFWAHIGGFVGGAVLALIWPKSSNAEVQYDELGGGMQRYQRSMLSQ